MSDVTQGKSEAAHVALALIVVSGILLATAVGYENVATLLGYGAVIVAVFDPLAGLGILLVHAPFQELTGFGPLAFHGVLITSILLGSLMRLRSSGVALRVDVLWLLFLAFGVYALIQVLAIPSSFLGEQTDFATGQLVGLAAGGGTFLAAQYLMRNRDWAPYLDLLIIPGVLASLLAIGAFATNDALATTFPGLFVLGVDNERAIGPFSNANYFGLFGALTLVVCLYRVTRTKGRARAIEIGAALIIATATLLSFSRAALAAVAIGVIVLAFGQSRRLGVATTVMCAVLAVVVAGPFLQTRLNITNPDQYIADQLTAQAESDEARYAAGSVGLVLFQRDPVFGVGFGQYHFVSPYYLPPGSPAVYAHDWYVNVLAEQGIIGVTLLLAASLVVVARLAKADPDRRTLALAVLAGYAFGNVFTESPTYLPTSGVAWFVVGAAVGTTVVTSAIRPVVAGASDFSTKRRGNGASGSMTREQGGS